MNENELLEYAMCPVCNHTLFYHCDPFDEEPQFYYECKNCDITFSPEKWTTRTAPKSTEAEGDKERIDAYVKMVEAESAFCPWFDGSGGNGWCITHLVSNAGGFGGGLGINKFKTFRQAMDAAISNEKGK